MSRSSSEEKISPLVNRQITLSNKYESYLSTEILELLKGPVTRETQLTILACVSQLSLCKNSLFDVYYRNRKNSENVSWLKENGFGYWKKKTAQSFLESLKDLGIILIEKTRRGPPRIRISSNPPERILRNLQSCPLEYRDDFQTNLVEIRSDTDESIIDPSWRQDDLTLLQSLNNLLLNTSIAFDDLEPDIVPGLLTRHRRVFNRGREDEGGRFYALITNMKRERRAHLLFDGQETLELDFSCLHPTLCLCQKRLPLSLVERGGFYESIQRYTGIKSRSVVKKAVMVLINTQWDTDGDLTEASEKIEALIRKDERFQWLESFIIQESSAGLSLQFEESKIAYRIIKSFVDADRPVLPIHDGFRVKVEHEDVLRRTMLKAFEAVTGTALPDSMVSKV